MIAYAQERFVAEALRAALAQTYSPLEIIVSDDRSPDRTFEIMQQIVAEYRGPHTVVVQQTPTNLRLGGHLNLIAEMARGELIAFAAGDDVSAPHRMEATYQAWRESGGRARSIFSNAIVIDSDGKPEGLYSSPPAAGSLTAEALADASEGVLGCTHAFHRSLYDIFGPLDAETHSEDMVLPFRASLIGSVAYVDDVWAWYRLHDTNRHFRDSRKMNDLDDFYGALRKLAPGVLADLRSRVRDLDTATRLFPDRASELAKLRTVCELRVTEAEAELEMLSTTNPLRRLATIAAAVRRGTTLRRATRWVLTFFFPRVYIRVQARLARKQGLGSEAHQDIIPERVAAGNDIG